jgi:hypothetical protein
MGRVWIVEPDAAWERLEGRLPEVRLSRHPSGRFLAMQVVVMLESMVTRAAIWNTETYRIEWNPANANALCWVEAGDELLVVEEHYTVDSDRSPMLATPLQREYTYYLRRLYWPSTEQISSSDLTLPAGWPVDIVPSPDTAIACVVWEDQHKAGIEWVSWSGGRLRNVPGYGYSRDSNLIQGPVFSPDGDLVAMSYGAGVWWSDERHLPSPGGVRRLGWVVVGKPLSGTYQELDVVASVPEGWLPDDPDDIWNEFVSCPRFADDETILVDVPTGEERRLRIGH